MHLKKNMRVLSCLLCLFVTLDFQASLSMDSVGDNNGVGCHAPSSGNLPNPEIQPTCLMCPALASGFFNTSATWKSISNSQNSAVRKKVLF